MTIETPRKTAYYKRKQAEHIFRSLQFEYFCLKGEEFWDFLLVGNGVVKLVKVLSSTDKDMEGIVLPDDKSHTNFDREIWRFAPHIRMPEITKFEKVIS